MPLFPESSGTSGTIAADQIKQRKSLPRNQFNQQEPPPPSISTETDPEPHISRSAKSTISSLFLSPFSTNNTDPTTSSTHKKKGAAFRGLGCTAGAAQQVSVPAMIRSSAEWEGKRVKKKKSHQQPKRKESMKIFSDPGVGEGSNSNGNSNNDGNGNNGSFNPGSCMVIQDVWCGPGIGLSADAVVGSVDCVVARRNVSGRGKIDLERINQREREREKERERERERQMERERERERSSCLTRRPTVNPEILSFWDTDSAFVTSRPEPELVGTRYYRHVRHPSPDGFADIMMLQNSFMARGRMDRFRDWRLDIDDMTYEELLELSDTIGYVSTGLKEDEITRCVSKTKFSMSDLSSHLPVVVDKKCTICQEEYEANDELGKLDCGHSFHIQCIKQWLAQKNACPVCKCMPLARG